MSARRSFGDWYFRTGAYAPPEGAYPWRWKLHSFLSTMAFGLLFLLLIGSIGR